MANLATVAILPASSDVPLTNITLELQHALKAIGKLYVADVHYENTPMQYTAVFKGCHNKKIQLNFFDIFLIFAQNIDCWNMLEPPH